MSSVSSYGSYDSSTLKLWSQNRVEDSTGARRNSHASNSASGDGDVSEISDEGRKVKSFMDKVKDGTVSDADLEEMRQTLSSSSEVAKISSTDSSDIGSFLKKVKNGTVSESDLAEAKNKIAQMESQIGQKSGGPKGMGGPPPGGGPPPSGSPPPGKGKAESVEQTGSNSIQGSSLNTIDLASSSSEDEDEEDEMDSNGDGTVSMDEYIAYYAEKNGTSVSEGTENDGTDNGIDSNSMNIERVLQSP